MKPHGLIILVSTITDLVPTKQRTFIGTDLDVFFKYSLHNSRLV